MDPLGRDVLYAVLTDGGAFKFRAKYFWQD
jgi:hypothetical protein